MKSIIKILVVIILCFIGVLIAQVIPEQWKYIFGYLMGTFVGLVCHLLED